MLAFMLGLTLCGGAAVEAAESPAEAQAIAAIRASGGQVIAVAQNDPRLDVAFHLSNTQLTPRDS